MGIAERREREREALRGRIIEAARDLLSEQGPAALSMRSIAERIEYSPATIYLYFRDKDELVREVVRAGFEQLREYNAAELSRLPETADAADQYSAMGRAYVRFALDNTAYFRVMFELPELARMECPHEHETRGDPDEFTRVVAQVQRAADEGLMAVADARRAAIIGWGLIHGLTSLYVGGHLDREAPTNEAFMALVDEAMQAMYAGWGRVDEKPVRGRNGGRKKAARA